ncbi:MAG: MarR family transcriptional regulator [Peptostreptococcaceae bacterium]|nr:MarR family transcriptional regulator [Peptostreptococcaceae bacterium]
MTINNNFLEIHRFYNLARYLFLNIDWEYNNFIKNTGISLPQLRVLWIIKIYPGISLGEIAKVGCWSPPTVTKTVQSLIAKKLAVRLESSSKKLFSLGLTDYGKTIIKINRLTKADDFVLFNLLSALSPNDFDLAIELNELNPVNELDPVNELNPVNELDPAIELKSVNELDSVIELFERITSHSNNDFLFDYINKMNKMELKIDYYNFSELEKSNLQKLIQFYNLLRTFVLTTEKKHRSLLVPLNLTYPQLRSLWIINAYPGITSKKLSQLAYLSPSTVNVIVKNLFNKNLVIKEKSELKNSLFLYITDSGKTLLVNDFHDNQKSMLAYSDLTFLTTAELKSLNLFMTKLNASLKSNYVQSYIAKTIKEIEKMGKKGKNAND